MRDGGRPHVSGARRSHAADRSCTHVERHVLVHARRGLDRRRERLGARLLGLRGGVGHPRRRHGPPGGRVDGRRLAQLRPGRGRREPLLPVPDHGALRDRTREAAVPRGLRHHPSAAATVEAEGPQAHALLRAPSGARCASSSRGRGGSGRSGSRRTGSSWVVSRTNGRDVRAWAARGLVPRGGGRAPRHPRGPWPCSTSRRSRSST